MLFQGGVESIVLETRTQGYVAARIRAGILESSTVELLESAGLGDRLHREGHEHRGIYLQWPEERHHLDFVDLTGRSIWVYGQTEVQRDLVAARETTGQVAFYGISDTAIHDIDSDRPSVTFVVADGVEQRIEGDVIVGCDGSFGVSRAAIPAGMRPAPMGCLT